MVKLASAPRAVLFDLDGTLLDTAPDFVIALNALRDEEALPPLPASVIRPHVSHGSPAMIRVGFDITAEHPDYERRRLRFLDLYAAVLGQGTELFEGMEEVLLALEGRGLPWGIVTNKPGWLTTPLLATLGLDRRVACAISGDTTVRAKPYPDPLLAGARDIGIAPGACLYVGDAERDIAAARAASMPVLVALYGYLGSEDRPELWGGDGSIACARDLLAWI
jgi:phosphoglycolate phosphatase